MKHYYTQNLGEDGAVCAVNRTDYAWLRKLAGYVAACAMLLLAGQIQAQSYSIPWYSTGGDTTSTGGPSP